MATSQPLSKSAKKKAAKAIERTDSPAPSNISVAGTDKVGEDGFESPYIKELQKNIRNVNKKLIAVSKTEELLKQHAGKSLDDLVASKTINGDQKAQIEKKPALQAQLAQAEEQLAQYQRVDEQYRTRAAADKAEAEKNLEKAKAEAVAEAVAETKKNADADLRDKLLTLTQFLRLAAYRREEADDPESDESQAIEGVLLVIYEGDESAVASMLKLIEGSSDQITSVSGDLLQATFSTVKTIAREYKRPSASEPPATEDVATDPTIANATVNELEAESKESPVQAAPPVTNGTPNAQVSDEAANAVAESHWDASNDMSASQEWVEVPRDVSETENSAPSAPVAAAPAAAPAKNQSWADDQPEQGSAPPVDPNDGFHQVQRNKGRNEGGGFRGGRGRGEWRGRGHRGDGRGRGRGNRNSGVPSRGGRRNDEA